MKKDDHTINPVNDLFMLYGPDEQCYTKSLVFDVKDFLDFIHSYENQSLGKELTHAEMYDIYFEQWFTQLGKELQKSLKVENQDEIKIRLWKSAKSIALFMHTHKITQIHSRPFFDVNQIPVKILLQLRLIRETTPQYYSFSHASLRDYFLSCALFNSTLEISAATNDKGKEELNVDTTIIQYFNQRLLVNEVQLIQFLAHRVKQDNHLSASMLSLLYSSRNNPENSIGAANAITILVKSGMTFNGADLSKVHVSGADISGGYFDQTNFEGADLSQVQMARTWLQKANLRKCQVNGVTFGEFPSFVHELPVNCIVYRPDLNRLVTTCGNNIILWDMETQDTIKVLKGNEDLVKSVSMSADGKIVASGGDDHTIRVWYLESDKVEGLARQHSIRCVHMNADGNLIVSCGKDSVIHVWDVCLKNATLLVGHTASVKSVFVSANGKTVVSGSKDHTVRVWDLKSGIPIVLEGHELPVKCVHMSADGKTIASCSGSWSVTEDDRTVRVWDVASGKATILRGHTCPIKSVYLSSDGKKLVSCSDDRSIRVWDLNTESCAVLRGHQFFINSVYMSLDGKTVASASDDKTVMVWDITKEATQEKRKGHTMAINQVCLSTNGKTVISGSDDCTVRIWDMESGLSRGLQHPNLVDCVYLSPDGTTLISGCLDGNVRLWEVSEGKFTVVGKHDDRVLSVHQSANGLYVASGSEDNMVGVWEIKSGQSTVLKGHLDSVTSVFMSSDGQRVASGSRDKTVRIWKIASRDCMVLDGHEHSIGCIYLSGDGCWLASGDGDDVRVWNVASGQSIQLKGHGEQVDAVHLSANGKTAISGSRDNTVRVWDVESKLQKAIIYQTSFVRSISVQDTLGQLAIGSLDSIQIWHCLDEFERKWQMKWSSMSTNAILAMQECDMSDTVGLSSLNRCLLEQREALVSVVSFIKRGNRKRKLGLYRDAITDYDIAIQLDPTSAEAFRLRGLSKNWIDEDRDAIIDFDVAIRLNPNDPVLFRYRGISKSKLSLYKEAEIDLIEACRLNPKDVSSFKFLGECYSMLGRHRDALSSYDEAIRLDSESVDTIRNRGITKADLGLHSEAIEDFNEAIRRNPHFSRAFRNRGMSQLHLQNFELALNDFTQAIEYAISPTDRPLVFLILSNQALTLFLLKHFKDSQETLRKADKISESIQNKLESTYCFGLSICKLTQGLEHYNVGEFEAGKIFFEELFNNLPAGIEEIKCELITLQGLGLSSLGLYQEAMDCWNKALELNAEYGSALCHKLRLKKSSIPAAIRSSSPIHHNLELSQRSVRAITSQEHSYENNPNNNNEESEKCECCLIL